MFKQKNNEISSNNIIKKSAIISYVTIGINILFGLIYSPWMINTIGKSEYGLYTLAITLITFFAIDFGLGEVVARFLTKYQVENDQENKKIFMGIIFKIFLFIDLLILITFVIIYIFAQNIYANLSLEEIYKFKIVFLLSSSFCLISFPLTPLNGILISTENFVFQKSLEIFTKVFNTITVFAVLSFGYRLYALVIVNVLVSLLSLFIKLFFIIKNKLLIVDWKSKNKTIVKQIFNFSIWTTIISVAQRLILNLTPSILAIVSEITQITIFSISMLIEGYIWTIANALNGLFLPKVTRIISRENYQEDLTILMTKVGRIQFFIIGLIITTFICFGKEFMELWMGKSFIDVYYVTILITVILLITQTQQIAYTALTALNEIKYRALSSVFVAVINIALTFIFSKKFGAIGSGIAILIANILGQIIFLNIIYLKVLKLNIKKFFIDCHIKNIIPLIICLVFGFAIQSLFKAQSLFYFALKSSVYMLLYMFVFYMLSFNTNEKKLLWDLIKKIKIKLHFNN